jgi:hypothetical protein
VHCGQNHAIEIREANARRLQPLKSFWCHSRRNAFRLEPGQAPAYLHADKGRYLCRILYYILPPFTFAAVLFLIYKLLEMAGLTSSLDFDIKPRPRIGTK